MAIRFENTGGGDECLVRTTGLIGYNDPYTLMGWFYLSSDKNNYGHFLNINAQDIEDWINSDYLGHESDGLTLRLGIGYASDEYVDSGTTLAINTWYHLAIVRANSTTLYAYLNGNLDITVSANVTGRTTSAEIEVGQLNSFGFNGRVAALKFYTYAALTADEIKREMYSIRPVRTASLNSWYPCFPGSSERLCDYSGNGYNWTESGTLSDEDPPPISWGSKPTFITLPDSHVYKESFDGAEGVLAGNWSTHADFSGVRKNGSGEGYCTVSVEDFISIYTGGVFANNQYSQAVIKSNPTANNVTLIVRAEGLTATSKFYVGYVTTFENEGQAHIDYYDGETWNNLVTVVSLPMLSTNDVVRLEIVGWDLTLKINGITAATYDDSTNQLIASGNAGVGIYDNLLTIDNWEGGSILTGGPIDEAVSLNRLIGISEIDQADLQDALTLVKNDGLTSEGIKEGGGIEESVTLGKILRVTERQPLNINEDVSLNKDLGLVTSSQTSEIELVSLGISIAISEVSEISVFEITLLDRIMVEISSDEINISETVILIKNKDFLTNSETIEYDYTSLDRSNIIDALSQTTEYDFTTLSYSLAISILEETQGFISEAVSLSYSLAIEVFQEGVSHQDESATLSRLGSILSGSQTNEYDTTSLNKLLGILATSQTNEYDTTSLNKLIAIITSTQSEVNDYTSLAKYLRITITDELIGQYSENVTLERFLALSVFQEGISHVNEITTLDRLNGINILAESKLYDSLVFNRLNGISISTDYLFPTSLILTRSGGIGINGQIDINENITFNKFGLITTSSYLSLNELVSLSKLNDIAIFDSRYVLENILLEYTKELLSTSSPSILENINLGRSNNIVLLAMLIAFNDITFGRSNDIIAEPPSLYVYNDGDHSVGVLFRDKRVEIPFRDKRANVLWRDKRKK